jgi:UPF0716 protein FxsA
VFGVILLLLLLVPIAELYVIIQVGQSIGALETVALLIVVSVVGAWLVKREGLGLAARIQRELSLGRVPTSALADGFLVLLAGALLLTPGFLTDVVGILLLLPPVRAVIRAVLMRRFQASAAQALAGDPRTGRRGRGRWVIYDARSTERTPGGEGPERPGPPPGELEP